MGLFSSIGKALSSAASFISPGVGSLLGGAVGAAGSFLGQKSANEANQASSAEQMAFQERMSNTQYQRATDDMRAAGINPILAYKQGGAGTPSGSSYQSGNVGAAATEGASKMAASAQAYNLMRSQIQKTDNEIEGLYLNNALSAEQLKKARMYNQLVLPQELTSAREGFALTAQNAHNQFQRSLAIGSLQKGVTDTVNPIQLEDIPKWTKENFNSAFDYYSKQKTTEGKMQHSRQRDKGPALQHSRSGQPDWYKKMFKYRR